MPFNFLTWPYRDIVTHFKIGESGVSQANRKVDDKVRRGKKIRGKIIKTEKNINLSRMKI